MKRNALIVTLVVLVAGLSAIAWAGAQPGLRLRGQVGSDNIAGVRANLNAVQMALESYAMDNAGYYPDSLAGLKAEGQLATLPPNPYDKGGMPMPEVRAGFDAPGGLTYIPLRGTSPQGEPRVTGYALLAYGDGQARAYQRRTHQSFRRNLPDASQGDVRWDYVVQATTGGTALTAGVGSAGGAAQISDAPCQ